MNASRFYRPGYLNRGFTLMEMLVSLLLFAIISTLLWQALGTMARLEIRLADSQLFVTNEALRREWLRQALLGLMKGAQGDTLRFDGTATRLKGYTSMPPWPGSSGPEVLELRLKAEGDNRTQLSAYRPATGETWPLWHWQGPGLFSYLDGGGNWQAQWPPPMDEAPELPEAIRLTGPESGMVWVTIMAGNNPMLSRKRLELLE